MVSVERTPGAAEIRLLCALVLKPALAELAEEFTRATGRGLTVAYDSARAIRDRVGGSEACDVAIVQKPAMEALLRDGRIAPGSIVTLARSGVAAAVRKGAPKPVIDSVEAFKRALLAARSVAYPDPALGHASGVHFLGVIERLGVAPAVIAKAKLMKGTLADFAAEDEAEIAITQPMEILAARGYDLIGWLPPELQDEEGFTWAAGVSANAKEADGARALIRFLVSPAAARAIAAKGMVPAAR